MNGWNVFIVILAILVVAGLLYALVLRQKVLTWGLTPAEKAGSLPGDDLLARPQWAFKQAITIHAPVEKVWPWLVQIGHKRAGWYSVDAIEKLIGAGDFVDGHSSRRIVPELQNLKVGDRILMAEQMPFKVVQLEPNRVMVLNACADMKSGKELDPRGELPETAINVLWIYYLEPLGANKSRLIVRMAMGAQPNFANTMAFGVFIDGGALLMQPTMLRGIKRRVESYTG